MKIKLLNNTKMPKCGRDGDAGYDLYLNSDTIIKPGINIIDTGVCIELPKGHAGLLAMRSSICKAGLILQQPLTTVSVKIKLLFISTNCSLFVIYSAIIVLIFNISSFFYVAFNKVFH